jgi:energy-coupling factor transporter ATP-binding protein EcfA2
MQMLTRLNQTGKTIIMVTHENDIAAWARRVIRLRDGHVESDVRNDKQKGIAVGHVTTLDDRPAAPSAAIRAANRTVLPGGLDDSPAAAP